MNRATLGDCMNCKGLIVIVVMVVVMVRIYMVVVETSGRLNAETRPMMLLNENNESETKHARMSCVEMRWLLCIQ